MELRRSPKFVADKTTRFNFIEISNQTGSHHDTWKQLETRQHYGTLRIQPSRVSVSRLANLLQTQDVPLTPRKYRSFSLPRSISSMTLSRDSSKVKTKSKWPWNLPTPRNKKSKYRTLSQEVPKTSKHKKHTTKNPVHGVVPPVERLAYVSEPSLHLKQRYPGVTPDAIDSLLLVLEDPVTVGIYLEQRGWIPRLVQ